MDTYLTDGGSRAVSTVRALKTNGNGLKSGRTYSFVGEATRRASRSAESNFLALEDARQRRAVAVIPATWLSE